MLKKTHGYRRARIRALRQVVAMLCGCALSAAAQRLTLHDAIEQGLSSPQALASAARVDVARGQVQQAGLGLNPRLFLQSEDWRPWNSDYSFPTQAEDYAFVSQTFETGGKRGRRVEFAQARLQQVIAEQALLKAEIAGRVASAYWNAVALDRTVALLQQDMAAVDEMVRYHKERVDAGAMRGVDLLRMQIERDRIEISLRSTERDAEQARLELFKQMGRSPLEGVQLADTLDTVAPVAPVPIGTVLEQRADVIAAHDAVRAAQADVKLQHAIGVPDLDLIGGYKRNLTDNTGYGSLQIPLPFRNRNQGEIARAKAGVSVAQNELASTELRVRSEVSQSEANYKREQEIVQGLLPDMRAKAKQNLQLMTDAYRIGGVDLLRYLDAERTEFDVEVNALRTLAEYQQAALRLQLSYGVMP